MNADFKARLAVYAGRLLLTLAPLALFGAWVSQLIDRPFLGLSQQHLFNDAIALALLGIGAFLDGLYHSKGL